MVFFSCSSCGESLKKNQVNKHYVRCRMSMVSCLDCNKEFWGDDFSTHTKCISEEEKYSGKDYKARPTQNKGEVKQDAWLQKVETAIDNSNSNPNIRNVLEKLKDYPNIPRKQAKFENFLHNSLRIRDKSFVKEIWDILMTENTSESKVDEPKDEASATNSAEKSVDGEIVEDKTKKESKREKKAKRSEKQNKKEKKDSRKMVDVNVGDESNNNDGEDIEKCDKNEVVVSEKKKKSKKRKHEDMETVENSKKMKNKEKDVYEMEEENNEKENEEEINVEEEVEKDEGRKSKKKISFDWEKTIISILKSKEDQKMSMKKVGKKVIAEYLAQGGYAESNDKLRATFTKKVTKNPRFVCIKDEVRLSREN